MPRTTDLRKYPPEFEHLLQRAAVSMVSLPFPTAAMAMRFRHRFYAYMKLLREGRARPELIAHATAVGVRMSDDRLTLHIAPEHDSWEGELIRAALGFERGAPTAAAVLQQDNASALLTATKAKLEEIRARKS